MQDLSNAVSTKVELSLGMLGIVVSVYGAVGDADTGSTVTVCADNHAPTPTKRPYICEVCGKTGHVGVFQKAAAVGDGFVIVPPEVIAENKAAADAFKKKMDFTVHPADEVSSVLMPSGKSYYLTMKTPNERQVETYTLLVELVKARPDLAFMAKFALRTVVSVFQLVVSGESTLTLRQMADAELVRKHPVVPEFTLDPAAVRLASALADTRVQPFLVADHGTGKSQIIELYTATQEPVASAARPVVETASTGNVLSLLEQMQAAVEPEAEAAPAPRKRAPRKTAAATTSRKSTTTRKVS